MMEGDTDDYKEIFCREQADRSLWQVDIATAS